MNLSHLVLLFAVVTLVGVGLIVEALKVLALRRQVLEPFEVVGMNAICVGFLGMAGVVFVILLV